VYYLRPITTWPSTQDELKELDDKYTEFADKEKELSKNIIVMVLSNVRGDCCMHHSYLWHMKFSTAI